MCFWEALSQVQRRIVVGESGVIGLDVGGGV